MRTVNGRAERLRALYLPNMGGSVVAVVLVLMAGLTSLRDAAAQFLSTSSLPSTSSYTLSVTFRPCLPFSPQNRLVPDAYNHPHQQTGPN